jgi:hypothetical protein
MRLTNFLVSRDPPTMVCTGGGGDGERPHGLKMKYSTTLFQAVMATCQLWNPPALAIVSGPM